MHAGSFRNRQRFKFSAHIIDMKLLEGVHDMSVGDAPYFTHALSDYLRENLSKILIAAGIVLGVVGGLFINDYYFAVPQFAFVPCILLFFGIVFVAYGFMIQVGLFSGKWLSIGGLGTMLLSAAVIFLSLAIVAASIQLVTGYRTIGYIERNGHGIVGYYVIPYSVRPFLYVSAEAIQLCLIFFLTGAAFKITGFLKH